MCDGYATPELLSIKKKRGYTLPSDEDLTLSMLLQLLQISHLSIVHNGFQISIQLRTSKTTSTITASIVHLLNIQGFF